MTPSEHQDVAFPERDGQRAEEGHQRFKMTVAYDGKAYLGWQWQREGLTIQSVLEGALARLFPGKPAIRGAGRTDTGVHALGMVCHLDICLDELRSMSHEKLRLALNAHLPEDIRVLEVESADPDFQARFNAKGKQYRYFIWNHPSLNPLIRHYCWHVGRKLDIEAMREASKWIPGRRDFRSFAAQHAYPVEDTVRTVTRCRVLQKGFLVWLIIEGDGFLYKMCRAIAGTLVQVGIGKMDPAEIQEMLERKDRSAAGMTAPAHGLVLWRVYY